MTLIDRARPSELDFTDPARLLRITELFARDPDLIHLLDLSSSERSWRRIEATERLEVWLLGWPAGTSTGWHDHQGSRGAFRVIAGQLTESTWGDGGVRERSLIVGEGRSFGARHVHNVLNRGDQPAVSVHVYGPALRGMTRYAIDGGRLVPQRVEAAGQW